MSKLKLELCSIEFSSGEYYDNIRKGILSGYFMQAAQREPTGQYSIVKDHHVGIFFSSFLGLVLACLQLLIPLIV